MPLGPAAMSASKIVSPGELGGNLPKHKNCKLQRSAAD
jgi:hypothetical protein